MTITLSENNPNQAQYFPCTDQVSVMLPREKFFVTISGVAILDFKGEGQHWRREQLKIYPTFRKHWVGVPDGKVFRIEQDAAYVTLSSLFNKSHAVNAGWAVDAFGGPGPVKITNEVELWANLAVCDIDGYLHRVSFILNLRGVIDEP